MQDLTSVRNVFGAQMTDGETGVHKEVDGNDTKSPNQNLSFIAATMNAYQWKHITGP